MADGKRGRRSKYTPERVEIILGALRLGMGRMDACRYAGITFETFSQWCKRHPEFAEAVEKAEAALIARCLSRIEEAAQGGTWQAAAWLLERKHPGQFGMRQRLALEGDENKPIVVQVREFVNGDAEGKT